MDPKIIRSLIESLLINAVLSYREKHADAAREAADKLMANDPDAMNGVGVAAFVNPFTGKAQAMKVPEEVFTVLVGMMEKHAGKHIRVPVEGRVPTEDGRFTKAHDAGVTFRWPVSNN